MAKSAGAAEYTVYISAEGQNSSKKCLEYYTTQSDGEVSVMQKLWGIWSTPSLPSLPGPLWPGLLVPDWVLSMGQIAINRVITPN